MRFRTLIGVGLVTTSLFAVGCTAEVEDKGEAPSVDVDPGRAPDIDVDPAKVEVGTDTQQVITPDVDIVPSGDSARDTTAAR